MATKLSRRNLFRLRPADFMQLFREDRRADHEGKDDRPRYFRPPGSPGTEKAFLGSCQRCQACVAACPHQAIESLGPVAGIAEGTPVLHPEKIPCHWCEDMPCIEACPSGTLTRDQNLTVPPIGKAVINLDTCLNTQGILCETCALFCPTHLHAISMTGRLPVLDEDKCTGCGLCAYHCDSTPGSIQIMLP